MIAMVAPRRKGKSYLIKQMLKNGLLEDFDRIKIYAKSSDFNKDFKDFREEKNVEIFANFEQRDIEDIFLEQEKCSRVVHTQMANTDTWECPHTLIILDDVIDSGLLNFKGVVDKIAERGRHINLSLIVTSQRLRAVSTSIRMNSDYFIIFATSQIAELERFLEEFVFRRDRGLLIAKLRQLFNIPRAFLLVDCTAEEANSRLLYSTAAFYVQGIAKPLIQEHEVQAE